MFEKAKIAVACGYCKGELDSTFAPFCSRCGVGIHKTCWEEFDGCATAFCTASPGFEEATAEAGGYAKYLELFPGTPRFCPNCGTARAGIFCSKCGLDYIVLQETDDAVLNGRSSAELMDINAEEMSLFDILWPKDFDPKERCENCGFESKPSMECANCLHEPGQS